MLQSFLNNRLRYNNWPDVLANYYIAEITVLIAIQHQLSQCLCGLCVLMDPVVTDCHLLPEETELLRFRKYDS